MSLDPNYWPDLAEDYARAALRAFGRCLTRECIELAMSVAEHETNNGRAWPGTNNFGAVQLRQLNLQERADFQQGTLKAGDYTATRDGVLHVDTHPTPSGPVPYPVWFAAFPDRVSGIAYFLKALWRLSDGAAESQGCTPNELAMRMYLHGYYEGAHAGGRPLGQRAVPLLAGERANVADYAGAIARCLVTISGALGSWVSPDIKTVDTVSDDTAPHPALDSSKPA